MKATPPNESTRTFSQEVADSVIKPAFERLGTRSQYTRLPTNLREFLDISDKDAATWVRYLLSSYKRRKCTLDDSDEFRNLLIHNTNAAIVLARALHRNNCSNGLLGEDRTKILGILFEFVHVSDDEAPSWIQYILEEYIGSKAIVKHSADFRQRLVRNVVAVIDLTRTLHEHHQGGGLYKLAQRGV